MPHHHPNHFDRNECKNGRCPDERQSESGDASQPKGPRVDRRLLVLVALTALLGWALMPTLFQALMRHHYSLVGAVP